MMRLNYLPSEFQKALPILKKIKKAGYEAYFVGGSVRDVLLDRPIHDVDITTSSYPEETKQIFKRTVDVGIEHGTVLVLEKGGEYEITTFRTEEVYVDYRRPSQVNFVRSLEEDLKRRDFTVNAFALNEDGEVIDLFHGLDDLDNHLLRAVGLASERFNEDALRIMRGLRFSASLNFDIETTTFEAMKKHAPLLEKISVERSFIEFDKLLLAPYWRKGMLALIDSYAFNYLPCLKNRELQLSAFLSQLDKYFLFETSEQAWASLILSMEVEHTKTFLKKWKTSTHFQKDVEHIVDVYRIREQMGLTKEHLYRYGKTIIKQAEGIRKARGLMVDFEKIEQLDSELAIHDRHEIVVNGGTLIKKLGIKPGPQMGDIISQIELAIVLGQLINEEEAILHFVKQYLMD